MFGGRVGGLSPRARRSEFLYPRRLTVAGGIGLPRKCGILAWISGRPFRNIKDLRAFSAPAPIPSLTPCEASLLRNRINAERRPVEAAFVISGTGASVRLVPAPP